MAVGKQKPGTVDPDNPVLEIFSLSDFAADYGNGKLSVIGCFDTIFTKQLPTVHPQCSISARMRFGNSEVGNHTFEIRAITPSGKVLHSVNGKADVKANPNATYSTRNLIMTLNNFKLEEFGAYAFEFWLNGEFHSGLKMHVVHGLPPGMVKAA